MDSISNEMLFYGGIIAASACAVFLLIAILLFRLRSLKLKTKLEKEYGEKPKN